jgi:nucleotide-binding universal stress UspA family protein
MFKKILAPLDGSALSEATLDYVAAIAGGCHVPEVILVRVRAFIDPLAIKSMPPKMVEQIEEASQREAETYLKEIVEKLNKKKITARGEVLVGNPAEEIIKYCRENGIDLIVMSTHGRSGVSRLVWGSVADKVFRSSHIPVLIIPASKNAA